MGIRFVVFGLFPEFPPEQKKLVDATVRDAIVRKAPSGVRGIDPKGIRGVFSGFPRRLNDRRSRRIVTVNVYRYPTRMDGTCCNLAYGIVSALAAAWQVPPWCNALRCEVHGFRGHSGTYEISATKARKQLRTKGGTDAEY